MSTRARQRTVLILTVILLLGTVHSPAAQGAPQTLFADEFTGPAGSLANPAKWGYEVGGGIRNSELQYYTYADRDNAGLDGNGHLRITLRKESKAGRDYTSAMLTTKGRFTFTTGCLEARIKVPTGSGVWPAFWTEGSSVQPWPAGGEIDVMERINASTLQNFVVHGGPSHWKGMSWIKSDPSSWHEYKMCIVGTSEVSFYYDGVRRFTVGRSEGDQVMPAGRKWPFGSTPHDIRLNIAMGGSWPGRPDGTAKLPATMLVDYVRVTTQ